MSAYSKRLISLILCFAFAGADAAQAFGLAGRAASTAVGSAVHAASAVERKEFPSQIALARLPVTRVSVQSVHQAPPLTAAVPGVNGVTVLHIQDAHSNLSGQKNLASALDEIMTRYRVDLVLVEGGSTDVTLDDLKSLGTPAQWKRLAPRLLYDGLISGEEYLNLTSDHPMRLIGIEEKALYRQSLKVYEAITRHRRQTLPYLRSIGLSVDRLKNRLYPPSLKKYESALKSAGFSGTGSDEGGDFGERTELLLALAAEARVDLREFTSITELTRLKKSEKIIDFARAAAEEETLITAAFPDRGSAEFREYTDARRAARVSPVAQLALLRELLARSGQRRQTLPAMDTFLNYLEAFTRLDMNTLMNEMELLEDTVYRDILKDNEDARMLRACDRFLGLLNKAYRLRLSSDEFRMLKINEADFPTELILEFLNRKLLDLGYSDDLTSYRPELEDARYAVEMFYRLVDKRDLAFIRNARRAIDQLGAKTAVLITGGYHTAHLETLMRQNNWSYAVLTPMVDLETDVEKYEALLLEPLKTGRRQSKIAPDRGSSKALSNFRVAALQEPISASRMASVTGRIREASPGLASGARMAKRKRKPTASEDESTRNGERPSERLKDSAVQPHSSNRQWIALLPAVGAFGFLLLFILIQQNNNDDDETDVSPTNEPLIEAIGPSPTPVAPTTVTPIAPATPAAPPTPAPTPLEPPLSEWDLAKRDFEAFYSQARTGEVERELEFYRGLILQIEKLKHIAETDEDPQARMDEISRLISRSDLSEIGKKWKELIKKGDRPIRIENGQLITLHQDFELDLLRWKTGEFGPLGLPEFVGGALGRMPHTSEVDSILSFLRDSGPGAKVTVDEFRERLQHLKRKFENPKTPPYDGDDDNLLTLDRDFEELIWSWLKDPEFKDVPFEELAAIIPSVFMSLREKWDGNQIRGFSNGGEEPAVMPLAYWIWIKLIGEREPFPDGSVNLRFPKNGKQVIYKTNSMTLPPLKSGGPKTTLRSRTPMEMEIDLKKLCVVNYLEFLRVIGGFDGFEVKDGEELEQALRRIAVVMEAHGDSGPMTDVAKGQPELHSGDFFLLNSYLSIILREEKLGLHTRGDQIYAEIEKVLKREYPDPKHEPLIKKYIEFRKKMVSYIEIEMAKLFKYNPEKMIEASSHLRKLIENAGLPADIVTFVHRRTISSAGNKTVYSAKEPPPGTWNRISRLKDLQDQLPLVAGRGRAGEQGESHMSDLIKRLQSAETQKGSPQGAAHLFAKAYLAAFRKALLDPDVADDPEKASLKVLEAMSAIDFGQVSILKKALGSLIGEVHGPQAIKKDPTLKNSITEKSLNFLKADGPLRDMAISVARSAVGIYLGALAGEPDESELKEILSNAVEVIAPIALLGHEVGDAQAAIQLLHGGGTDAGSDDVPTQQPERTEFTKKIMELLELRSGLYWHKIYLTQPDVMPGSGARMAKSEGPLKNHQKKVKVKYSRPVREMSEFEKWLERLTRRLLSPRVMLAAFSTTFLLGVGLFPLGGLISAHAGGALLVAGILGAVAAILKIRKSALWKQQFAQGSAFVALSVSIGIWYSGLWMKPIQSYWGPDLIEQSQEAVGEMFEGLEQSHPSIAATMGKISWTANGFAFIASKLLESLAQLGLGRLRKDQSGDSHHPGSTAPRHRNFEPIAGPFGELPLGGGGPIKSEPHDEPSRALREFRPIIPTPSDYQPGNKLRKFKPIDNPQGEPLQKVPTASVVKSVPAKAATEVNPNHIAELSLEISGDEGPGSKELNVVLDRVKHVIDFYKEASPIIGEHDRVLALMDRLIFDRLMMTWGTHWIENPNAREDQINGVAKGFTQIEPLTAKDAWEWMMKLSAEKPARKLAEAMYGSGESSAWGDMPTVWTDDMTQRLGTDMRFHLLTNYLVWQRKYNGGKGAFPRDEKVFERNYSEKFNTTHVLLLEEMIELNRDGNYVKVNRYTRPSVLKGLSIPGKVQASYRLWEKFFERISTMRNEDEVVEEWNRFVPFRDAMLKSYEPQTNLLRAIRDVVVSTEKSKPGALQTLVSIRDEKDPKTAYLAQMQSALKKMRAFEVPIGYEELRDPLILKYEKSMNLLKIASGPAVVELLWEKKTPSGARLALSLIWQWAVKFTGILGSGTADLYSLFLAAKRTIREGVYSARDEQSVVELPKNVDDGSSEEPGSSEPPGLAKARTSFASSAPSQSLRTRVNTITIPPLRLFYRLSTDSTASADELSIQDAASYEKAVEKVISVLHTLESLSEEEAEIVVVDVPQELLEGLSDDVHVGIADTIRSMRAHRIEIKFTPGPAADGSAGKLTVGHLPEVIEQALSTPIDGHLAATARVHAARWTDNPEDVEQQQNELARIQNEFGAMLIRDLQVGEFFDLALFALVTAAIVRARSKGNFTRPVQRLVEELGAALSELTSRQAWTDVNRARDAIAAIATGDGHEGARMAILKNVAIQPLLSMNALQRLLITLAAVVKSA